MTAKILAGVIRSETDAVSSPLIEKYIEEYLSHQIRRADYESGLQYKINQYEPLIRQHFVTHPNEDEGRQYTTPDALENELPRLVRLTIADLEENIAAVNFDTWRKTNVDGTTVTIQDIRNWVEDLAEFRSNIATLSAVTNNEELRDVLMGSDLEYGDDYYDPAHYVSSVTRDRLQSYGSADTFARYVASHTFLDLDDDRILEQDRPSVAVTKFETGDTATEREQLEAVAKKVT
ncbi:hypothetical protein ACFQHN_25585 [Natrialbaceae archaeon GCM10025896]